EVVLAMTAGLGIDALGRTIHPYPTVADALRRTADAQRRTRLTPRVRRLEELGRMAGVAEVVVVDGGSGDRTAEITRGFSGVRLVSAARGRGSQMNAGARVASGNVFLFLHADVALPPD